MNKKKLLFLLLVLIPSFIYSQEIIDLRLNLKVKELPFGLTKKVPVNKPEVSLVLSGGGSRAIAHIGVLKAIEELKIPVDNIVGTSMGSVIGGLYSLGYSIPELDSIVRVINWDEMFALTSSDRKNLFVDQKITEDKALITIRLDGLKPSIPQSINTGNKIANLFTSLTLNAPINNFNSFDNLLFKFRAISTDLITGNKIVLSKGSISEAMRASSSISFLLPPVNKDSLILVDGGLVDNLPVNSAKELNSDFIIASDATSALRKKDELNYPWEIADQIVSIPSKIVLEAGKQNVDVLITHNLNGRKKNNFEKLEKLIDSGYIKAKANLATARTKIKNQFLRQLSKNNRIFYNLTLSNQPNNIENKVFRKLKSSDSISKAELLFTLYNLYESGDYKNLSAQVIIDTVTQLNIKYEFNAPINSVNIKGVTLISIDSAYKLFNNLYNKPYNSKKTLKAILRLMKKYRNDGYIAASVDKVNFNENTGELTIFVNEGKISEIVIEGNEHTLDGVVTREFPSIPGNFLLKEDLEEGLQSLSSANLFKNVFVGLDKAEEGKKLKIKLEEKLPNVLRLGLRIDNEYHTQVAFDLRNENLFGTSSELGFSIAGGSRNMSYVIEHKANRIFDTYLTYKAQVYYKHKNIGLYGYDIAKDEKKFSRSQIGEYKQIFYGGFLGAGAHLKRLGTLTAEGKYQINEIQNLVSAGKIDAYKLKVASLKLRLQIDSQNKYPYPTKGVYINTYYETAQKLFGGDVSFAKLSFDYEGYFTFNNRHTIKPKLIFGFADETLPLSEHFSFGGQQNFWGYRDYEFRGRQILIASMEYRYNLPFRIYFDTYFKVRYDLGSTWINQEQVKFEDLKHGVGFSLSFDTPIGPAEFSVGRSLLLKKTSPKRIFSRGPLLFYFTIGYYY